MALQTHFDFRNPTQVVHGPGSRSHLADFLSEQKPLVVTDKGLVKAGIVDKVLDVLTRAGIGSVLFDGALPNPPGGACTLENDSTKKPNAQPSSPLAAVPLWT